MDRLVGYARDHRRNPTEAESMIWQGLRASRQGFKVSREKPMLGKYIVDFYVGSAALAIEIDGEYHMTPEQQERDAIRTKELNEYGIKVIRFTNSQVYSSLGWVFDQIRKEAEARIGRVSWRKPHVATLIPDKLWMAPQVRTVTVKNDSSILSSKLKEIVGPFPDNVVLKISWEYVQVL